MSRPVGASVEELRALSAQFASSADRLRHISTSVRQGIQISAWVGPIAVNFRHMWDSEHSVRLKSAAAELDAAAGALRRNADEQERASATGGDFLVGTSLGRRLSTPHHASPAALHSFAWAAEGRSDKLPKGWHEVTDSAALDRLGLTPAELRDPATGLDAHIYTDAQGNYVLAFAGTSDGTDWREDDATVVSGFAPLNPSEQAQRAADVAYRLKAAVGADHIQLTGHSLGGRDAAVASVATGIQAFTFDAAGPTDEDLLYARTLDDGRAPSLLDYAMSKVTHGDSVRGDIPVGQITNYVAANDPLTIAQQVVERASESPFNPLNPLHLSATREAIGDQVVVAPSYDWNKVAHAPNLLDGAKNLLLQGHDMENFDGKLPGSGGGGEW